MIRIVKILTLVISITLVQGEAVFGQQLPQFSQYIFNGLHVNPAYAGYKNAGYIQSVYRSQWVNFPGAPKTFSVTADFSANEGSMGFGISFLNDQIGPTESKVALLTYSYRIRLGTKSFVGLGVSSGFSEYMLNPFKLVLNKPDDALIPGGIVRKAVPNLNSGLFFHSDRYFVGFSMFNMMGKRSLMSEDVALAYHDFHYYLTAGALFQISKDVQFKPSFLFKQVKGSPTNYDLNAMFLFKERLWLGGSLRSNARAFKDELQEDLVRRNAVAMIVEFFATPQLRIGYAYDHNLNVLGSYGNNSHEISMGYYLKAKNTIMKSPRWF